MLRKITKIITVVTALALLQIYTPIAVNTNGSDYIYSSTDDNIESAKYEDYNVVWKQDGYSVHIILQNTSETNTLNDWALVYSCDAEIKSANNASIIFGEDIHYLKCTEENSSILPCESTSIDLLLTDDTPLEVPSDFSVYFLYNSEIESYDECTDFIGFNGITNEMVLNSSPTDTSSYLLYPQEISYDSGTADQSPLHGTDGTIIDMLKIINGDNRQIVMNTHEQPYSRIALLVVTFDDKVCYGTGFMISENYMVTAAHVVYDAQTNKKANSLTAYFGRNSLESFAVATSTTSLIHVCVTYPVAKSVGSDWAVCKMNRDVGNTVGWFDVGYPSDEVLSNCAVSVTGYPSDKFIVENGPLRTYMYTASSKISRVRDYSFTYTADTYNGESGSPIYRGSLDVVYGVHSGAVPDSDENQGKRFTESIYNTWKSKGWIN